MIEGAGGADVSLTLFYVPKQKGAGSKVKTSRHPSQDENVLILNYTNSVKQRVLLFLNLLVSRIL